MLMLPATRTRPIYCSRRVTSGSSADGKLLPDFLDVGKRRQAGLVAEALDLEGRGGAREIEMVVPAFAGIGEIGINVGAVEHVARAVGVDHALGRNAEGRQSVDHARLVVPVQALLAHGDAA